VVLEGHVPNPEDLRRYYNEQFQQAQQAWQTLHPGPAVVTPQENKR
jgi:hypothetical protein